MNFDMVLTSYLLAIRENMLRPNKTGELVACLLGQVPDV
jgi:hypothetical protein